jgi:hexokinase
MSSSLLNEATRIADQFAYPAEQVQRGVAEYIKQSDEGLGKEGATLSQIPTFVTAVPNGTEKVRWQIPRRGLKTHLLVIGPISRR